MYRCLFTQSEHEKKRRKKNTNKKKSCLKNTLPDGQCNFEHSDFFGVGNFGKTTLKGSMTPRLDHNV